MDESLEKVRRLARLGINKKLLARCAKVHPNSLNRIETRYWRPLPDTVRKLSDAADLFLAYVRGEAELPNLD